MSADVVGSAGCRGIAWIISGFSTIAAILFWKQIFCSSFEKVS